ncbi:MAG: haloacid dehalogenase-like hydrolase, partial [Aurantimicrobium sp.]|uniref:haloacid dehalogenase-like hydrolase n=3 Tax=Aurantimicrobium sp. TaxID=1930784 RepID=UPI002FCA8628
MSAVKYVIDFDGVLVSGDVTVDLINRFLRRYPARIFKLAALIPNALAARNDKARARLNRRAITKLFAGITRLEYSELLNEVLDLYTKNPNKFNVQICQEVMKLPREEIVVATGADTELVKGLLKLLGMGQTQVLGSTFSALPNGIEITHHNVGQNKVQSLILADVYPRITTVYTDSAADLPLIRASQKAVLVNPKRKLVKMLS